MRSQQCPATYQSPGAIAQEISPGPSPTSSMHSPRLQDTIETTREFLLLKQFMQSELDRQVSQMRRSFELYAKEAQAKLEERVNLEITRELMPINAEITILRQEFNKLKSFVGVEDEALYGVSQNFAAVQIQVAQLEQRLNDYITDDASEPMAYDAITTAAVPLAMPRYAEQPSVLNGPNVMNVTPTRPPLKMPMQASSLRGIGGDLGPAVRGIESEAMFPNVQVEQAEFIFVADPSKGHNLGLHVIARNDNDTVEVAGVLAEGLAQRWNQTQQRTPIKIGDIIWSVNGIKGGSARILEQLRLKEELRLHLKRAKPAGGYL